MKKKYMLLLMIAGVLLVVNVFLTSLLLTRPVIECQSPVKSKSIPCESVPLKWAVNNVDCANSLLRAMNVTNVNFLPKNSTNTMIERVRAMLQNNSYMISDNYSYLPATVKSSGY
jgi:hypothetical protein